MSKLSEWFNSISSKLGEKLQDEGNTPQHNDENMQVAEPAKEETRLQAEPSQTPGQDVKSEKKKEKLPVESEREIDSKETLPHNLIRTLSKVIEERDWTKGKKLVVWLDTDQLTFESYNTTAYRQQLLNTLVNERGYGFSEIVFNMGTPDESVRATPIGNNVKQYIQVLDNTVEKVIASRKAVVSIFGNAGSLLQSEYHLSSEEMQQKRLTAYNIGAGQFPQVNTGYRENHIAIDDNPNSPMVEKNKFVSRMHAHIGYSEKFGFYLQVERDGTRLMGKRTRIFRGGSEKPIECDNPQAKVPLKDGDLIELGKAVVLKYEEE